VTESKNVDFVVRLVGSGIKPWKLPMRTLSKLMDAIQRLVEQSEEDEPEINFDDSENQEGQSETLGSSDINLVRIRATSAAYSISSPVSESAVQLLAETGHAIENPADSEWSAPTVSSIQHISEIAKRYRVRVEIRKPYSGRRLGDVIAKITPETYDAIAGSAYIYGQTALTGTVEKVGGAQARCTLRLPNQSKLVYCRVANESLAQKLSQCLYQDVSIHGEATWLRANWQIRYFQVTSFEPPKTGSIRQAMRDIWKAGGKAWDNIKDPDAYIADMRGA
jgi:hypothetical protein